MKIAYADPPYPGQAYKYRNHPDFRGEVDHYELIWGLNGDYPDGWALSTSANSLAWVLKICNELKVQVRIAIWCKSNAMPVPGQRITYAWEAVLWRGGRASQVHGRDYMRDYLVCGSPAGFMGGTIVGQKPPEFCQWLFMLLGLELEDELVDLFPGSGVVQEEWKRYKKRLEQP